MEIDHTSAREIGQIYLPGINWALMVVAVLLVVAFGSSSELAAAYGIAVSTTMIITTLTFNVVARERFRWKWHWALAFLAVFLAVDLAFLGANALKLLDGGWFPLALAAAIYTLMATWKKGRAVLSERMRDKTMPIDLFLSDVSRRPQMRVAGTAVFMTGNPEGIPPALLHNLKHNKVIHEQVVLVTVVTNEVPHIAADERIEVKRLQEGFYRVVAHYGFMEDPNIPEIMNLVRAEGVMLQPMQITYFLGRDSLIVTKRPGMARWRKRIFEIMSRNARSATAFFGIPYNQVVELGAQIEL